MQITVSNYKVNRNVNVEIPDEMLTDPEDLRFIIGTEQFTLKSTKTEKDKEREKQAIDFGEEFYPEFYKLCPNFGKEGCSINTDKMKELIKEKLLANKEKYKALAEDENFERLLLSLATAYSNYCSVRERMDKEDKELKETSLDENVFYDYIKRFKKAITEAKCIKDVHEAIVKIHHFAGIDNRDTYGYAFIMECMNPFYEKIFEIEKELEEQKPKVNLKDHKLYTDTEFWEEQQPMVFAISENFDKLEKKYKDYEKESENYNGLDKDPFDFFSNALNVQYSLLINSQKKLTDALIEASKNNDSKTQIKDLPEEIQNKIIKLVDEVNNIYKNMIIAVADIRVKFNVDKRTWSDINKKAIINANFNVIDFWYQNIKNSKPEEKATTIRKMVDNLILHGKLLSFIKKGTLSAKNLCEGKYSNNDLNNLINQQNQVKVQKEETSSTKE